MTGGRVGRPQKIEPPLFAGKHSGGSDRYPATQGVIFYLIAASQQRSSCRRRIDGKCLGGGRFGRICRRTSQPRGKNLQLRCAPDLTASATAEPRAPPPAAAARTAR